MRDKRPVQRRLNGKALLLPARSDMTAHALHAEGRGDLIGAAIIGVPTTSDRAVDKSPFSRQAR